MTRATALPVEERILQLLQYLGIDQAHFAGRTPGDWTGLATTYQRYFPPSPSLVQGVSPLIPSVALLRGCWFSPGIRRPPPSAYGASWKIYRMLVLSRSVTTPCWGGLTWSQTVPTR